MKVVQIPGGTASLREHHEIRTRHKQLVELAAVAASAATSKVRAYAKEHNLDDEDLQKVDVAEFGLDLNEARSIYQLRDAMAVAALASWTLPDPIPDMDTIGDTTPEVSAALYGATASMIGPILAGTDFEPHPNRPDFDSSPTEPSADSSNGSRADQESSSTETPKSVGRSMSSAVPSPEQRTSST